jgi:hypothetical protein
MDGFRRYAHARVQTVEVIVFHFERTYFAVLQQFFVLNFVIKKFTKVQHDLFLSILTGNKPAVS